MSRFTIHTEGELSEILKTLPDWSVADGKLTAEFVFADFREAMAFIQGVALEADKQDHHPEWSNAYNKVRFSFNTHDAGYKITSLDTDIAQYIAQFAAKFR